LDSVESSGQVNRYPFLTPERENAIITAVHRAMTERHQYASTSRTYKNFKRKNVSLFNRINLETSLQQVFADMRDVQVTYIRNTFVIIFDGKYFLYLRRSESGDACFSNPKVLRNLQIKFYSEEYPVDQPLPGMEHLVGMPITDVCIVSGLYVCDDDTNVIVGFYINQQEYGALAASESIPLDPATTQFPVTNETSQDATGIDFSFKNDNDENKGDQASRSSDDESVG